MKNLFLWYIPQAAFFGAGVWFAATIEPPTTGIAMVLFGVMLAAAYTGGVNLVISVAARLRRNRSKPSTESQSLGTRGRLLGQGAQQRHGIGVDKDLR